MKMKKIVSMLLAMLLLASFSGVKAAEYVSAPFQLPYAHEAAATEPAVTEAPTPEAPTEEEHAVTEAPAETEEPVGTEEPAETEEPAVTDVPDQPEETEPAPTEEAPDDVLIADLLDALDPSRHISIYASWEGETVGIGDWVTLHAVPTGYDNAVYTLQWERSADNSSWSAVEGAVGDTYTVQVTTDNVNDFWRVALLISDVHTDAPAEPEA